MSFLLDGLREALARILAFDRDLMEALATTLRVSVLSTLLASLAALPTGFAIARGGFRGKRIVLALLKTALAFPTVVVALWVYAFLARPGPLGGLGLLFTPTAIVIGQVVLITPLMTALVHGVLQAEVMVAYEEAILLGASRMGAFRKTLLEARVGITTAVMTGFGRVVSEVGISLILGGNIVGSTRTMTTAIALETGRGNFPEAAALGLLLLALVLVLNGAIQLAGDARESL